MNTSERKARLAVLSILHCRACANLLRAHGQSGHAQNLAAALDATAEILAHEFGRKTLNDALDWASDRLSDDPQPADEPKPAGKYLN